MFSSVQTESVGRCFHERVGTVLFLRNVLFCSVVSCFTPVDERTQHADTGCEAWVCSVSLVYQKETLEIEEEEDEEEGNFTLRPKATTPWQNTNAVCKKPRKENKTQAEC